MVLGCENEAVCQAMMIYLQLYIHFIDVLYQSHGVQQPLSFCILNFVLIILQ